MLKITFTIIGILYLTSCATFVEVLGVAGKSLGDSFGSSREPANTEYETDSFEDKKMYKCKTLGKTVWVSDYYDMNDLTEKGFYCTSEN